MRKKRILAAALAALTAAVALAGCAGGSGTAAGTTGTTGTSAGVTAGTTALEPGTVAENSKAQELAAGVTISFWHSMGGSTGEALNTLVEKFNKENPDGIKVDAQYQGSYDDSITKLKSAQIGSMGADLVQIYDLGTRFMVDSGWIIPMQELIDQYGFDVSKIEPNIAAYYTVDSKLYSMPFNSSTPILYYNKDIFEKAGITKVPESLEEIGEIGETLKTKGGASEVLALGIYGWFFEQFTCKQGAEFVDNGNGRTAAATNVTFDSNGAGLRTLTAWKDLHTKGYIPDLGRGTDGSTSDFCAGKAAMTMESTASLKRILTDAGDKFEVGTAYFPKVTGDDKGGVSIGGASLWALQNNDAGKEAAVWKFIEFLVSPESQAYWNSQTGYFPVTLDAHEEPVFKDNIAAYPQFQTAIDQLHDSTPQSAGALLSVFPEARQIVETEIENMLNNNTAPEEEVKKMADSINKAIEEYNLLNQ